MDARPQWLLGHVMHHRLRPAENRFVYPVFCLRLPLRRLHEAENALFRIDRPGLLGFHQRDHGPRDGSPLLPWIETLLAGRGLPHDGEIILQCFPRLFGFVFNPVSFWFCHDRAGALVAVLAEVNNTFGEHHHYLLHRADGSPIGERDVLRASKRLHVSPFNTVIGGYRFRFRVRDGLAVARIDYDDADGELLRTAIAGRGREWSAPALLGAVLRMPLLTFGVVFRIHWQALRLWLKGVPFVGARSPVLPTAAASSIPPPATSLREPIR